MRASEIARAAEHLVERRARELEEQQRIAMIEAENAR